MEKTQQKKAMSRTTMIFAFLQGAKRFFILGALFACCSNLTDMIRPRIIQMTVDGILTGDASVLSPLAKALLDPLGGMVYLRDNLWLPALAVILCALAGALFRYFYEINTAKAGEAFVKRMRDMLFAHIERLPVHWHSEHQTGDIIQRCTTDVEEVKSFLADQMVTLVSLVIRLVLALIFMARVNGQLTLVALACVPVFIVLSFWFHRKIGEGFLLCDQNEGVLSTIAQENLTGVRVVRAFGRERAEQERFSAQNELVTDRWIALGRFLSGFWSVSSLLVWMMHLIVLAWGTALCVQGRFTVGGLLAILSYLVMLERPIRGLGRVLSEMSKTGVSITRLQEIMAAPVEEDVPDAVAPPMNGDIVFDHVTFAYPGQSEVLRDVSFTVPAGTTLGILGGTGSGKSTLAHLLARLYPLSPENGRITVGGVDLQSMQAEWVRRNVGFVLQEPFLFSRTIADNLSIARPDMAMEDVRLAARAACLESAVDGFTKGFDTFVGERGVTLSGGQKQRAAIARTLAQNSPILIFDDSLSAVDAETDAMIRQNLKTYMGQATVLLISHRITTLMAADQILVLENGAVTDHGTPAELAARPGLYRTICDIQQGEEVDEDVGA